MRVARPLGRVLGGDPQLELAAAGPLAQLLEPVGAVEHVGHPHRMDANAAFHGLVVPAAHDRHTAAIADRRQRGTPEQGGVEHRVHPTRMQLADHLDEPVAAGNDRIGAEPPHQLLIGGRGIPPP